MTVTQSTDFANWPWLQQQWDQLIKAQQQGYLTHAYLFYSQQDLGVTSWLQALATYLLCSQPSTKQACGQCHNCHLRASGSHPDCHLIGEEGAAMIKVDAIRQVQETVYQTRQIGEYRIFILPQAHRLNQAASNALLKMLEEPPDNTLFLLESQYMHRLLPTIISRCQVMTCLSPSEGTLKQWAQQQGCYRDDVDWCLLCRLAHYSPWVLKQFLEGDQLDRRQQWFDAFYQYSIQRKTLSDTITVLTESRLNEHLQYYYFWVQDMIKLQQGASWDALINYDQIERLQDLAQRTSTQTLLNFMDLLQDYWQYQQLSYNINTRLALENILLVWRNGLQQ